MVHAGYTAGLCFILFPRQVEDGRFCMLHWARAKGDCRLVWSGYPSLPITSPKRGFKAELWDTGTWRQEGKQIPGWRQWRDAEGQEVLLREGGAAQDPMQQEKAEGKHQLVQNCSCTQTTLTLHCGSALRKSEIHTTLVIHSKELSQSPLKWGPHC